MKRGKLYMADIKLLQGIKKKKKERKKERKKETPRTNLLS